MKRQKTSEATMSWFESMRGSQLMNSDLQQMRVESRNPVWEMLGSFAAEGDLWASRVLQPQITRELNITSKLLALAAAGLFGGFAFFGLSFLSSTLLTVYSERTALANVELEAIPYIKYAGGVGKVVVPVIRIHAPAELRGSDGDRLSITIEKSLLDLLGRGVMYGRGRGSTDDSHIRSRLAEKAVQDARLRDVEIVAGKAGSYHDRLPLNVGGRSRAA